MTLTHIDFQTVVTLVRCGAYLLGAIFLYSAYRRVVD